MTGIVQYNSGCCVADLVPMKLGKLPLPSYFKGLCRLFNASSSLSQILNLKHFLGGSFSSAKCATKSLR